MHVLYFTKNFQYSVASSVSVTSSLTVDGGGAWEQIYSTAIA